MPRGSCPTGSVPHSPAGLGTPVAPPEPCFCVTARLGSGRLVFLARQVRLKYLGGAQQGKWPATSPQPRWVPGDAALGAGDGEQGQDFGAAAPGSAPGRWATDTFRPAAADVSACVSRGTAGLVGPPGMDGCLFWVEGLDFGALLGILVASGVSGVPILWGVPAGAAGDAS